MKEYIIKIDEQKKDIMGDMPLMDSPHELIRCKNCKFGHWWSEEQVIVCDKLAVTRKANWFCADAERKVNEA